MLVFVMNIPKILYKSSQLSVLRGSPATDHGPYAFKTRVLINLKGA